MENKMKESGLEKGNTYFLDESVSNISKEWNPHPKFKGVYLKHIITGEKTANIFSSHVVKIEPYCILEEHVHEGKIELHEVIKGNGRCNINGKEIEYLPGDCALIPESIKHEVKAGKDGLIIHAKFMPALI